jgi:flagellar biosynthesis protein FliP
MRMDAHVNRRWPRWRGAAWRALCAVIVLSACGAARAQEIDNSAVDEPKEYPLTDTGVPDRLPSAGAAAATAAQPAAGSSGVSPAAGSTLPIRVPDLSSRENFSAALQIIILLTVLSLAPAILIMMTSFTRIIIVLSLLRQALGTQQLPPNQVLIGLSMFMTFLVMGPTWTRVNNEALRPYLDGRIEQPDAFNRAAVPVREFMIGQIIKAENQDDVFMFMEFAREKKPEKWDDVKLTSLVPAFMLSELKMAFFLGFKIYLPFLIIDIVISTVLISMGMMMLPPVMISLPFKLLLFVLVDGWSLITRGLMGTFAVT